AQAPLAAPAVRADETGPVFLDQTSMTEALPEPAPERVPEHVPDPEPAPVAAPAVWQADPVHQAGFGGPRDPRVSWGSPQDADPEPVPATAEPAPTPAPPGPG
ncbi:hypothetical protein ADK53_12895, partial [Streptomyces sp. WM6373]